MINLIFTYDYEIFGDGQGTLNDCILKNTNLLNDVFEDNNLRYVNYVEAAEFIKIKEYNSDTDIFAVESQIIHMYKKGYEIGLHLHPQWFNSKFENGKWQLDFNEYNICKLESDKTLKYIDNAIQYLRSVLNDYNYNPVSFRAGNWLIQPTERIIGPLVKHNIKIDSSVFKGGVIRNYGINFKTSLKNGYYWPFLRDVNIPSKEKVIWEVPIYSVSLPFWKSISRNKINALKNNNISIVKKIGNYFTKFSFYYPLKFDFTKLSFLELQNILLKIIETDKTSSQLYKPIVLIGHSKNNFQIKEIEKFLKFIKSKRISVVLFKDIIENLGSNYIYDKSIR